MPKVPRAVIADGVYHVLNRANGGATIFEKTGDYEAFEKVLAEAHEKVPMRTISYLVMPNHWHFVLQPRDGDDLSKFMGWLTLTHTNRWHAAHGTTGAGHVYQGPFKSFAVQSDEHYLTVCRYVERNALRAGLVTRADDWRWSSLWRRQSGDEVQKALLSVGPLDWPEDWLSFVNQPQLPAEEEALRKCIARGRPYGGDAWVETTARRLGLTCVLNPRGRPRGIRVPSPASPTSTAQNRKNH